MFFEWHKWLRDSRENVDDDDYDYERSGRSRSHRTGETVEKLRNLMHSDTR
jgi:hypothetical protein